MPKRKLTPTTSPPDPPLPTDLPSPSAPVLLNEGPPQTFKFSLPFAMQKEASPSSSPHPTSGLHVQNGERVRRFQIKRAKNGKIKFSLKARTSTLGAAWLTAEDASCLAQMLLSAAGKKEKVGV